MASSCTSSSLMMSSSYLFHVSSGLQVLGFLLLQTFAWSRILLRLFLSISHILLAVWAFSTSCSTAMFIWALVLASVNAGQTLFLIWKNWTKSLPDHVMELYNKKFEPYGLSVNDMADIVKGSTLECGGKEDKVWEASDEDNIKSLGFLLTGRLVARFGDKKLHYVEPGQCVNSVEWKRGSRTQGVKYGVEKAYKILNLPTSHLKELQISRPDLSQAIKCVIGRDIVDKLKDSNNNNYNYSQVQSQGHNKNGICRQLL